MKIKPEMIQKIYIKHIFTNLPSLMTNSDLIWAPNNCKQKKREKTKEFRKSGQIEI